MPTLLGAAGAGHDDRLEGRTMLPALRGEPVPDATLFWEHIGNAAIRRGRWKLVREHAAPWELYDMDTDRSETTDLARRHPALVAELAREYDQWAQRVGVIPRT